MYALSACDLIHSLHSSVQNKVCVVNQNHHIYIKLYANFGATVTAFPPRSAFIHFLEPVVSGLPNGVLQTAVFKVIYFISSDVLKDFPGDIIE